MILRNPQVSLNGTHAMIEGLKKAADKLSALIKCIKEENSGNTEFISAKKTLEEAINSMKIEEVTIFCEEFLPSYYKTLDELHMGQEK